MATGRVGIKYATARTAYVPVLSSGIAGWGNNAEGMARLSLLFTWYAWFVTYSRFAEDNCLRLLSAAERSGTGLALRLPRVLLAMVVELPSLCSA